MRSIRNWRSGFFRVAAIGKRQYRAACASPNKTAHKPIDLAMADPLYRATLAGRPATGRVAQRESTPFTREGSQVQSLSRPPDSSEYSQVCMVEVFGFFPIGAETPEPRITKPRNFASAGSGDGAHSAAASSATCSIARATSQGSSPRPAWPRARVCRMVCGETCSVPAGGAASG